MGKHSAYGLPYSAYIPPFPPFRPPPSFRRRSESRTPGYPAVRDGRVWIPAFAGMTVGAVMAAGAGMTAGQGGSYPPTESPSRRHKSTPAETGRPPPSFRRRPESRTPVYPAVREGGGWIPAFAGMTARRQESRIPGGAPQLSNPDKPDANHIRHIHPLFPHPAPPFPHSIPHSNRSSPSFPRKQESTLGRWHSPLCRNKPHIRSPWI